MLLLWHWLTLTSEEIFEITNPFDHLKLFCLGLLQFFFLTVAIELRCVGNLPHSSTWGVSFMTQMLLILILEKKNQLSISQCQLLWQAWLTTLRRRNTSEKQSDRYKAAVVSLAFWLLANAQSLKKIWKAHYDMLKTNFTQVSYDLKPQTETVRWVSNMIKWELWIP